MDKNRVRLDICGVKYFICTDESVEHTEELGKLIDEKMSEILKAASFISANQAAVLVSLDLANELSKAKAEADGFRNQIKEYLEDSAKAKSERDYYKRELKRIKTEATFKNDQINLFAKSEKANGGEIDE